METVGKPRRAVDVEIPADRIGAVFLQGVKGVDGIALGLAHLLAVLILDMAEDDDILIGRLVKEKRRLRKQGVEPASRLIHGLGDKLGRELGLEKLFILKRIVVLCKGHGSGVEPAVDDLRYPVHFLTAFGAGNHHIIDKRPVKLHLAGIAVHFLLIFLNHIPVVGAHLL